MDLGAPVDVGKLTVVEAAELSKLLQEKWGSAVAASDVADGDLIADFIVPLLSRVGASLPSPADHVADVRRRLSGQATA